MSRYQVTIDHRDGTSETYSATQEAAYARVDRELSDPTPGVAQVDIRPVAGRQETGESR